MRQAMISTSKEHDVAQIERSECIAELVRMIKTAHTTGLCPVKHARIITPHEHAVYTCETIDEEDAELARVLVQQYLDRGYIQKVKGKTEWLLKPRIVHKGYQGDEQISVCMSKANKVAREEDYAIPKIARMFDYVYGSTVFSCIQIKNANLKMPLKKQDQEKTAFMLDGVVYKFKVLPVTYTNTTRLVQKGIEKVLGEELDNNCVQYIDSILVYTEDIESHREKLVKVLKKLIRGKLEIDWCKTEIGRSHIEYLGYEIECNKIMPAKERIDKIRNSPQPQTLEELRSFVGKVQYDRRFIPNATHILRPLTTIIGKGIDPVWTGKEKKAYETVKEIVSYPLCTALPNYKELMEVWTVATQKTVSVVIRQTEGVVEYISKAYPQALKPRSLRKVKCAWAMRWATWIVSSKYPDSSFLFDILDVEVMSAAQRDKDRYYGNTYMQTCEDMKAYRIRRV